MHHEVKRRRPEPELARSQIEPPCYAAGTPLERTTRWLAVLTGFSIPLSTSFSEIVTGLFMACWLLSGNLSAKWNVIRRNIVALLSLILFGLLLAGMSWSSETWESAGRCVLKYRELIYVPMFIVVFRDPRLRGLATYSYIVAATILLALSYGEWLSGADFGISSTNDYVIAKDRIIHSLMMAFLVYLSAVEFGQARSRAPSGGWQRHAHWLYAGIMALAAYNILFMVQGRTGYLLLGALVTLFLCQRLGKRGVAIACLVVGATAWGALTFSTLIRARVDQTIAQIRNQFGPQRRHSPDPRLEFYANTLRLIGRHPLCGTGTGSFRAEYARLVADTQDIPTSDPHNEYMHLAAQVGLPGAGLFIALLAVQWFAARRLTGSEMQMGRGIVLTIALGSLFNSLILSMTGGLIYAYFSGVAFAGLADEPETGASQADNPPAAVEPNSCQRSAA